MRSLLEKRTIAEGEGKCNKQNGRDNSANLIEQSFSWGVRAAFSFCDSFTLAMGNLFSFS